MRRKPRTRLLRVGPLTVLLSAYALVCAASCDLEHDIESAVRKDGLKTPSYQASTPGVSVTGVFVDRVTGEPIAGVHIRLIPFSREPDQKTYGAISKEQGRFSMTEIPPGIYQLTVDRIGYCAPRHLPGFLLGGLLDFRSSHSTTLRLSLPKCGTVSGRVLDVDEEPMSKFSVRLVSADKRDNHADAATLTDDRGEYLFSAVAPGKYHALFEGNRDSTLNEPEEVRSDGSRDEVYYSSFYPGVTEQDRAAIVEVAPGAELIGIDIRPRHSQPLSISGTISGIPQAGLNLPATDPPNSGTISPLTPEIYVNLTIESDDVENFGTRQYQFSAMSSNGRFSVGRLHPGTYRVYAQRIDGKREFQSKVLIVPLADASIDNLDLVLSTGLELKGAVTLSSVTNGKQLSRPVVMLVPARRTSSHRSVFDEVQGPTMLRSGNIYTATFLEDGEFGIVGLYPDVYEVRVSELPGNAYVERMLYGGEKITDSVIDLGNGNSTGQLEIILNPNGASLYGKLKDQSGNPLPLAAAVWLIPETTVPTLRSTRFNSANSDSTYFFKGVIPGRYRICAPLLSVRIEDCKASGEVVELKPGESLERDIRLPTVKETGDEVLQP